jgi:BirA family biotin operon repressor/biotin-[acetyl-CoA-carboxylase] ligase
MDSDADLTPEALEAVLAGRPIRSYAAVVSTGVAAHAWAVDGAPGGAVVVAGQQLSPRGHAGRPLSPPAGDGLGFSVVMRPALPVAREGWLYTVVLTALADVLGEDARVEWPDEVRRGDRTLATAAITARAGDANGRIGWAIADVLVAGAAPPRAELLRAVLGAVDTRASQRTERVVRSYERACATLGARVRLRLRAGTAPTLEGRAVGTLDDGAIVLATADGSEVPVRPQDVRSAECLE